MEEGENKEKGLTDTTMVFMIVVAIFFDVLQWALAFILMGWLAGIFAGLTFYIWFRSKGISFMKPKRLMTFGGTALIEAIPLLSSIPAWTFAVSYLTISSKIKKVVPIANAVSQITTGKVIPFKSKVSQQSTDELKKAA